MTQEIQAQGSWQPNIEAETLSDGSVWYFASHPYLPGCVSDGRTAEDARENWDDALAMYIAHYDAHNIPRPQFNHFAVSVVISDAMMYTIRT
jgi:predicted RNase H-like HicB family nuclease